MRKEHLSLLSCPETEEPLRLAEVWEKDPLTSDILFGVLEGGGKRYLIFDGVLIMDTSSGKSVDIAGAVLSDPALRSSDRIDEFLKRT
ncbi:MAG: hypothetical protein P8N76_20650 [Pirellulaceae bacterium]|nr:hypothetical protein [Pirellulaceae bacterium]